MENGVGIADTRSYVRVWCQEFLHRRCLLSVFQQLEDESIYVEEALRYYPYRATFDFECYFEQSQLPSDRTKHQWLARHELLSVRLALDVPGYETAQCFVTAGDSNELTKIIMMALEETSEAER